MKTMLLLGALSTGLVGATVGLNTAGEVIQVATNRVTETIVGAIPLDIEIERLELLLTKVEREASRNTNEVARAQIALEDAVARQ